MKFLERSPESQPGFRSRHLMYVALWMGGLRTIMDGHLPALAEVMLVGSALVREILIPGAGLSSHARSQGTHGRGSRRALISQPRHMIEPCSRYCEKMGSASSSAAALAITLPSSPKLVM